jgi:acetylornithine/succinyldiaminopimelate/putrescine aminotransferase
MSNRHPLFQTWDQIIREQIPNFLRLYLNPYVAQTCLCLSRYVQETWHPGTSPPPPFQSFLANSFDEALSGAIKLARFSADAEGRPKAGLVIDPAGRLGPCASVAVDGLGTIEFIPDLVVVRPDDPNILDLVKARERFGFVVLFPAPGHEFLANLLASEAVDAKPAPLVITCVDRAGLALCRGEPSGPWGRLRPDIAIFDESLVHRHVPFGAFTARKSLYDYWNRPRYATFHSTTFQPNTVSSLHFLKCLEEDDPEFFARLSPQLERVAREPAYCKFLFGRLYNQALVRATSAVGWDVAEVRAGGHYVTVNGRKIFDGVAGVACSVRGHNPPDYRTEIERLDGLADYHRAAAERLEKLTGLGNLVPAVSGASAVENALRLGLVAQFPRNYVLAFRGGFGGKTLLALTGTANRSYKTGLDPLYGNVCYVDPFAPTAVADLETALDRYPVGVVQLELVQAVGGVRAVPENVIRYLDSHKLRRDYLLFVDEVQTGMYRTGPFLRSQELGIQPDLLTLGKGTSDMMFPFSGTLYSDRVRRRLEARQPGLPDDLRRRFDYEFGYKTLINVLDRAAEANVSDQVREMGELFARLLGEGLASCRAVRDVRVFGLLIGIELDTRGWPRKWFRKQAGSLYVLNLLRHQPFPVFVGYCQYEPHVLKFTPPLSITREEVKWVCETITAVLRRPFYQLLPGLCGALVKSFVKGKWEALEALTKRGQDS